MTEPPKLSLHLLIVALALVFVGAAGPQSATECQEGSPMGASYLGKENVTASGLICQSWSSSKPHEHQYDEVGTTISAGIQIRLGMAESGVTPQTQTSAGKSALSQFVLQNITVVRQETL